MTDKSDDKVGHLNTILARGVGNLNDPILKSSNAWGLPGGGGGEMLRFRVDRRIISLSVWSWSPLNPRFDNFHLTLGCALAQDSSIARRCSGITAPIE